MRYFYGIFFVCLSIFSSAIVGAQPTALSDAVGKAEMGIAFESSDPTIATIGKRAFDLHGGYQLTSPNSSTFVVRVERGGSNTVLLTIGGGRPYVEQYRQTVTGSDLQDAVLRACDITVRATLRVPGFFGGKLAFVGKQRGVSEIYVSDLLFSRVRPVTGDRSLVTGPSWSPNGSALLYTTYHQSGFPDIYKLDLNSMRRVPVANFKGTNTGGKFSPDGQRIAMALTSSGNSEIYVSDANGKGARRLTTNKSLEASPSWSPDGRRLVFTSDAMGKPQLFEISASGGPMRRIATNVSSYCAEPVWNPVHSNLIAFTAAVGRGFQVVVYDANTGESKILTKDPSADAVEPTWLNDGRHLVFTLRKSGRTRLMILDTKTERVKPLHVPSFGDASSASFVY